MDEIIEENVAKQTAYLVGHDDGKEEGIKEGIKEGILENQKEVVLNMYKDNLDLETISKVTNLSLEKINEIIISNNYEKIED